MPKPKGNLLQQKLQRLEYLRTLQTKAEAGRDRIDGKQVFKILGFKPNRGPQTQFLALPDENLDVLYGGSAGGGKSHSLLMYAIRSCAAYPGLQAFWFRRTFPELEHSVIRLLARYSYCKALGCKYNATKYELQFPNGSILTFGHAKNLQEATALQSAEINLLILDERTTVPPDVVDLLYTRIRSGVEGVPCLGVRSGTNPGGPGHGHVKKHYVEATDYGQHEIERDANNRRRIFIQARAYDTPQLGKEYINNLSGLPENLRKAFLDGDWHVFVGQVFTELSRDRHVVIPTDLPKTWRRYAGVDWGFTRPWAVVWAAIDEDGRVWVYRELYATQVGESDQARRILSAEGDEDVTTRFADDAMWATRGQAKPIAQVYEDEGCLIEKAGKGSGSRVIGWQRIHSYLADGPACPHHRALGWDTCPMLHMFSTCENLYRSLADLPYAQKGNPEDVDTSADDHLPDALRYLLTNLGNEPKWYFVTEGAELRLVDAHQFAQSATTPLPTLGGHPILPTNGDPWSNLYT